HPSSVSGAPLTSGYDSGPAAAFEARTPNAIGSRPAARAAARARTDPTACSRATDVRALDPTAGAAVEIRRTRLRRGRGAGARRRVAGVRRDLAGHEPGLPAGRAGGAADRLAAAAGRHGALHHVRDAADVAAVVRCVSTGR